MALLKAVKTNFGIDATYWNIFSINENFKDKVTENVELWRMKAMEILGERSLGCSTYLILACFCGCRWTLK
jgi:hypothetical protein